jgi:hypothetical protein
MYFVAYPFKYLKLRRKDTRLVLRRDIFIVISISIVGYSIFQFFPNSNFFGTDGFLEKMGGLTSSLTGFYIAGLLAVATFSMAKADLDNPITVGPVYSGKKDDLGDPLSRREYVCLMFGYLALLSLLISIISVISSGLAPSASNFFRNYEFEFQGIIFEWDSIVSFLSKFITISLSAHLIVTTGYGLYYLTYKIYAKEIEIIDPDGPTT